MTPLMPPLWDMGMVQTKTSFPGLQGVPLGKLHRVRHDIPVGQDGALRITRRPAGVQEDGHIRTGIDDHVGGTFPARADQLVKSGWRRPEWSRRSRPPGRG